jgi:hypothetical protein
MHHGISPSHDFDHGIILPKEIAGGLDAMTPEIMHGSPAGFGDIPEVSAVWSTVGLSRPDPEDPTNGALFDHLASLYNCRSKNLCLGIAVDGSRAFDRFQHRKRLTCVPRQRLGAHLIPFRFRKSQRNRQVLFVRQRDEVEIDVRSRD